MGEYDCTKVMVDCAKDGTDFTALPHFVSHHLPDTCQDVAQKSTIARFESFQKKCAGKKDFLALAEVYGEEDEDEDEAEPQAKDIVSEEDVDEIKMEEEHIIEEQEDLKEEQEEIMEEIEAENAEKSAVLEGELENEEEEEDISFSSLPMAGMVIVVCAVVASLVVIKKKFSSSKPQKTDFAPVSHGGFEYEDDADAGNFIA